MRWIKRHLNRRISSIFLLLTLWQAALPSLALAEQGENVSSKYQLEAPTLLKSEDYPRSLIGPGDLIAVTVYGEEDLPTIYLVDSGGVITFPLLGDVVVAGLTQGQACALLAKLLRKDLKSPQVTVLIQESNYYTVSVLGAVNKPGRFSIRGIPTLLSVLADAGGPAESANISGAILIHANKKRKVDLSDYLEGEGKNPPMPLLYPGDVVVVPRSWLSYTNNLAVPISLLASVAAIVSTVYIIHKNP